MDTIKKIEEALKNGELNSNPGLCAEYRAQLSGEYSFLAGQLEEILKTKPALWNARRSDFKSDTACDRWFESTHDGINETAINLRLKRVDKMMQGLNGLIRAAEGQANNQY